MSVKGTLFPPPSPHSTHSLPSPLSPNPDHAASGMKLRVLSVAVSRDGQRRTIYVCRIEGDRGLLVFVFLKPHPAQWEELHIDQSSLSPPSFSLRSRIPEPHFRMGTGGSSDSLTPTPKIWVQEMVSKDLGIRFPYCAPFSLTRSSSPEWGPLPATWPGFSSNCLAP